MRAVTLSSILVPSLHIGLVISATLCVAGCGPEITEPGATGQISILPGQDLSAFTTVEIRLYRDQGKGFDFETLIKDGNKAEAREDLGELPMDYTVVHDDKGSPDSDWRVTVWLSTTAEADAPASGDLLGSAKFNLENCSAPLGGEETFCGTAEGVDVLIDRVMVIQ